MRPILLLLALAAVPASAHQESIAIAVPLSGIQIDGRLDDWPAQMPVHSVAQVSAAYRPAPPDGPADLEARFAAGYDAGQNLLYLALVVRDEDQVVRPRAPAFHNQDLCEIYIDADHSGGDASGDRGTTGAQQYVMVPGPGRFHLTTDANPGLHGGSTSLSGVRAAFLRVGDLTVYEWAIPLFDRFPDERWQIETGQTIGLDLAVVDADGAENGNWVSWTPGLGKTNNSDTFGDLHFAASLEEAGAALAALVPAELLENYGRLGRVSGQVQSPLDGTPLEGMAVRLQDEEGQTLSGTRTDGEGRYAFSLLPGTYRAAPLHASGQEPVVETLFEVAAGGDHTLDFAPRLGCISGRATSPEGRPWAGLFAHVQDEKGKIVSAVPIDSSGTYRVWLTPGAYQVSVRGLQAPAVDVELEAVREETGVDFVANPTPSAVSGGEPEALRLGLGLIGAAFLVCLVPLARRRERLGGMLLAPRETLDEIAREPDWQGPALLVLVSALLGLAAAASMFMSMSSMSVVVPMAAAASGLFGSFAVWFMRSGLFWVLARSLGGRTSYFSMLCVMGYAYWPLLLLGGLISSLAFATGQMQNFSTMGSSATSLAALLPDLVRGDPYMGAFLGEFEPFYLWSLVLSAFGLRSLCGFSTHRAALAAVLYFFVVLAILLGGAALVRLAQQMAMGS